MLLRPRDTAYEWVTFKTFRKTLITLLANEHDLRTAQQQAGHSSESTTQSFYDAGPSAAPRVAETIQSFAEAVISHTAPD